MGRPTKCTPETIERAVRGVKLGLKIEHAAQYAGITGTRWYDWLKRAEAGEDPYRAFRDAVKAAEAEGVASRMAMVVKAAQDGGWQAAAWILERRDGYTKPEHRPSQPANQPTEASPQSIADLLAKVAQQSPHMLENALANARPQGDQPEPVAVGGDSDDG